MPGKTVSLRRFTRPLALETPLPYRMRRDALRMGPSDPLLHVSRDTPLWVVLWRPNLDGAPPFRVVAVRAGAPDRAAGLLPTPGLRPRAGEHVVHVQPTPVPAEGAEEQRY